MSSHLEAIFAQILGHAHVEEDFVTEFRFHPTRKWRLDFANPEKKIAVEIDGGVWMKKGRHTTGSGFVADMEKFNAATCLGWRILRYYDMDSMANFERDYKELLSVID